MSDLAIGIDLGTTYCCMSVYRDGNIEIIPNDVGSNTTPSFVHFDENNFVTAGPTAKGLALDEPQRAVYDVKRLIGRRFDDPVVQQDMKNWPFPLIEDEDTRYPRILLNEKSYVPEHISAHVLEYLKNCAEEWLNCPVTKTVITVPAYFNEAQRHATKLAGNFAGMEVLKLLHEPTAAAVTYCYHNKSFTKKKTVLVFDLGGGTFDVVVMTMKDRRILIEAVGGDSHLGGQDIDRNLVDYCLQEFKAKNDIDLGSVGPGRDEVNVARLLRRLHNECEEKKKQLSHAKQLVISLDGVHGDMSLNVKLTREKFEHLNDGLFQKCVNTVQAVVEEANLTAADIDEVIMVGGTARIPKMQELVMRLFHDKKLNKTINADEAVSCGAAIQAALLTTDCPALKIIFPDIEICDEVSPTVDTKQLEVKPLVVETLKDAMKKAKGIRSKFHQKMLNLKAHGHSEHECWEEQMTRFMSLINLHLNPAPIPMLLQFIANQLLQKVYEIVSLEIAWEAVEYLTQETSGNCERFLEHLGIELFLDSLNAFPNDWKIKIQSMLSLINVANREHLRPQLMKSELISVFYNFLESAEDGIWVSYNAAEFLTHILSDGEAAWTIESPRRSDVLRGIRQSVKSWGGRFFYFYYSSLQIFLKLLNATHTTECQLFAAWTLRNSTKAYPEIYVPMLVKEGGIDILNKFECEDEDVRKWVNTTLKQCNEYP